LFLEDDKNFFIIPNNFGDNSKYFAFAMNNFNNDEFD